MPILQRRIDRVQSYKQEVTGDLDDPFVSRVPAQRLTRDVILAIGAEPVRTPSKSTRHAGKGSLCSPDQHKAIVAAYESQSRHRS